jgi:hypothetical protein
VAVGGSRGNEQVVARISSRPIPDRALVSHARIHILANGRTVLDAAVPRCALCRIELPRDLQVVDLDGDPYPDVALRLRTGEGSCCAWLDVFHRVGTRYAAVARNFYSCAVTLRDLDGDGRSEIVACDSRFTARFAVGADSRTPLRVWRFGDGRFELATRAFPAALRADATRAWSAVQAARGRRDIRGVFAAWAADSILLGDGPEIWRRAESLRRSGALSGDEGPAGATYVAFLRRQLAALGYR